MWRHLYFSSESSVVDLLMLNMGRTNLEMSNDSTLNAKYKLHTNKLEQECPWGTIFHQSIWTHGNC